jgi:hypothetical protein
MGGKGVNILDALRRAFQGDATGQPLLEVRKALADDDGSQLYHLENFITEKLEKLKALRLEDPLCNDKMQVRP